MFTTHLKKTRTFALRKEQGASNTWAETFTKDLSRLIRWAVMGNTFGLTKIITLASLLMGWRKVQGFGKIVPLMMSIKGSTMIIGELGKGSIDGGMVIFTMVSLKTISDKALAKWYGQLDKFMKATGKMAFKMVSVHSIFLMATIIHLFDSQSLSMEFKCKKGKSLIYCLTRLTAKNNRISLQNTKNRRISQAQGKNLFLSKLNWENIPILLPFQKSTNELRPNSEKTSSHILKPSLINFSNNLCRKEYIDSLRLSRKIIKSASSTTLKHKSFLIIDR